MTVSVTKATVNNIDEWRVYVDGEIAARCPTEQWANKISILLKGISDPDKYEPNLDFKFEFETDKDLFKAELTGYIPLCDVVRIKIKELSTNNITDYPLKSKEAYLKALQLYKSKDDIEILDVYQDKWMYDIKDYE